MQLHNSQAFYHHFAGRGHVLSQKAKPDTDPRQVLLKYVPTVHPWQISMLMRIKMMQQTIPACCITRLAFIALFKNK
jgi:hypothetical protein